MSLRLITIVTCLTVLPACTTVDFSSMANNPATVIRPTLKKNIVERSVGRLHATFFNKGWCERDSRNRMEAAAEVLLKGLNNAQSGDTGPLYATSVKNIQTLKSDIILATNHIEQTTKAAEVFLAMALTNESLRKELHNLERAVVVTREAKVNFQSAAKNFELSVPEEDWAAFELSLLSLSAVTDQFGQAVRLPSPSENSAAS